MIAVASCADGETAAPTTPTSTISTAAPAVEEDELDRVTNAWSLAPEDEELVRGLLDDPWLVGVDGPLRVAVEHDYSVDQGYEGLSRITFEYVTSYDVREFSFDHDGCGTQPEIVNGVRYVVDPSGDQAGHPQWARAGAGDRSAQPWVTKSFTWEWESGARHSCV